jgi:hypothetical protein
VTRMIRLLPVILLVGTIGVSAQDGQPAAAQPSARPTLIPLKITLVISRYQGEKKLSSVPYTLAVTANEREPTRLRMGTKVPVVSTTFGASTPGGPASIPQNSYTYHDVGTNIDCTASTAPDGAFKLFLTVTDSSVYYPDRTDTAVTSATASTGAPAFRNFTSTFNVLLRDGQSAQYIAATDSVSGQTVKIDATINVQK